MTATLFLLFVLLMVVVVVELITRYSNPRNAPAVASAVVAWIVFVGVVSYFGVVGNTTMRPPGIVFVFLPVAIFLVVLIIRLQSAAGATVARAFPLWIILGTQSFRIFVELFIHQLWREGLVPKMLTFAGANVDIYIGATAPVIAWFSTRGPAGRKLAFLWNIVGLCALANIVVRAVLTSPGPLNLIHTEVPNRMIGTFPFTFIPGFFVPLAAVLHVVAMRAAPSDPSTPPDPSNPSNPSASPVPPQN